MSIFVPATSTTNWQDLLRDPIKQWRHGYSAKSLADHWQDESGFPEDVQAMFNSARTPGIRDSEMLLGIPEAGTKLPGGGYDSQTDLFVLAKCSDGLITITVEGKVNESFDQVTSSWLHKNKQTTNRQERLDGLCEILGIDVTEALELRYQLLHRTASALIEAERFSANTAIMLVHSFSPERKWFDDYVAFGHALGVSVEYGQITEVGMRAGCRLMIGWLTSPIKAEQELER